MIFALFELVLQSNHEKPFLAVCMVLLLLVSAIVILYLTTVHTGYYLNPATVGLLAIAINLGHLCFARVKHKEAPGA
jgi:hypothetical protein